MSEEQSRYHVRCREFLNENLELPAFIIGVVEDTRRISDDDPDERWNWGTVMLDLADCYRRVIFDFDMTSPESRANSLRKINLIAEVVNAVRDGIALEVESRNARPAPTEVEPTAPEVEKVETITQPIRNGNKHFFTSQVTTLGL